MNRHGKKGRILGNAARHGLGVLLTVVPLSVSMAGTLGLPQLEERLASSLRLKSPDPRVDVLPRPVRQEAVEPDTSQPSDADGRRNPASNDPAPAYNVINPRLGISYSLVARDPQLDTDQADQTQARLRAIAADEVRRGLLRDLRKAYTLSWQYHQQRQIAERYLDALSALADGAAKTRQKEPGESAYARFNAKLAMVRDDEQRFRALERSYMNATRSIVGTNFEDFVPLQPEFPRVCSSIADLDRSAQRNSPQIQKLDAEMEALAYERKIDSGGVTPNFHLGVSPIDEQTTGRRAAYSAVVGLSINIPANFQEVDQANSDRRNAAAIAKRTLGDQARQEVLMSIEDALENFQRAQDKLQAIQTQLLAAHDARQQRLDRMPPPSLDELTGLVAQEYQVSLQEVEAQGTVFQRTSELLMLAPDSCSP